MHARLHQRARAHVYVHMCTLTCMFAYVFVCMQGCMCMWRHVHVIHWLVPASWLFLVAAAAVGLLLLLGWLAAWLPGLLAGW